MPAPEPTPDIRDIAPPIQVADPLPLWVYPLVGITLLALLAGLVWWLRRRPAPAAPQTAQNPRAQALDILHTLKQDYANIPPGRFADDAIGALRLILAERFGSASHSQTPDEFFATHRADLANQFDQARRDQLAELLSICDRMRFAPEPDHHSERLPLAESALAFVLDLPAPPAESDAHSSAA